MQQLQMPDGFEIRLLNKEDPEIISKAFEQIGFGKPVSQYQRYIAEQRAGTRICFVASVNSTFAGYVTVNWKPAYPGFAEQNIPEIQDLNVIPEFRRQGIGTRLLDRAEEEVSWQSFSVASLQPLASSARLKPEDAPAASAREPASTLLRSVIVGIGVGLHPGYSSAQRLYVKRGYVPDGRGVWYGNRLVEEGMQAVFDDNLVLHLTKKIRAVL